MNMKINDIVLLGAVAVGGYFLYKTVMGQSSGSVGGGVGGGISLPTPVPGDTAATKVFRTVTRVGGRDVPLGIPYNPVTGQIVGKYVGHLTSGTPFEQIVQYQTGPKVVKVNGKSFKVM